MLAAANNLFGVSGCIHNKQLAAANLFLGVNL